MCHNREPPHTGAGSEHMQQSPAIRNEVRMTSQQSIFTTDDKVGIGIESPTSKLHVLGNSLLNGVVNIPGGGSATIYNWALIFQAESLVQGRSLIKNISEGLDIVGAASTSMDNRKVTFHSQGGITFFNGKDITTNSQMNVTIYRNTARRRFLYRDEYKP